jgi:hypothetical protein
VGGFLWEEIICCGGCVCGKYLFFLVHVSVTLLLIRCFAPLMHDYVDIVVEGRLLVAVNLLFFCLEDNCN